MCNICLLNKKEMYNKYVVQAYTDSLIREKPGTTKDPRDKVLLKAGKMDDAV